MPFIAHCRRLEFLGDSKETNGCILECRSQMSEKGLTHGLSDALEYDSVLRNAKKSQSQLKPGSCQLAQWCNIVHTYLCWVPTEKDVNFDSNIA